MSAADLLVWAIAALLSIWFGYPFVVAALGLFARRRIVAFRAGATEPRVSVIIATRDAESAIRARVDNVKDSAYPPHLLEVVAAVDHAEGPAMPLNAPGYVLVVGDAPGGKAASLNAAVRRSQGEVLVFTDIAQRFDRDTIPRLVSALERDARLGAVSGSLEVDGDTGGGKSRSLSALYWRFERWLREREATLHSAVGVTGAVYAMRRVCWQPLPTGLILDDVYGPMRIVLSGWRVGFERSATAYDQRRFTPAQELKRKARTLTGVFQLCGWLPAVLDPLRNPIWIQFVFHKLLRLATPYLAATAVLAALWIVARALVDAPLAGLAAAIGLALVVAVVWRSSRAAAAVRMVAVMQLAMIRATINGLRGDWDVWAR
jgi:cellulose synthase/poly-beta-1,6-N-acetylglucosamine synthase-like glycosyltransferase